MRLFETKYRIVLNKLNRYEPEYHPWWWPFWLYCNRSGSWDTISVCYDTAYNAAAHIRNHKIVRARAVQVVWQDGDVT